MTAARVQHRRQVSVYERSPGAAALRCPVRGSAGPFICRSKRRFVNFDAANGSVSRRRLTVAQPVNENGQVYVLGSSAIVYAQLTPS